jgi:undecaprenyl diphosphate synthase
MDGNGRWAARRGQPRTAGHLAGARAVRRTVEAAARLGIETLTLYAFSADNWKRPATEVQALMRLFRRHLLGETARCVANGVRVSVIGRRDRLDPALVHAIRGAESATREGTRLRVRIAVDYSARDVLQRAAALPSTGHPDARADFAARLGAAMHDEASAQDVDLLIRTGGEQRLSDFLLWECAYAELWFTPDAWPDFGPTQLAHALHAFTTRERRFGSLSSPSAHASHA